MRGVYWTLFTAAIGLGSSWLFVIGLDGGEGVVTTSQIEQQDQEQEKVLPGDSDSIGRRDYMRVKLMFTQNIVEGLTMKKFDMIGESAKEIHEVTKGAAWNAVDSDEYRFQSREFQRSVESLIQAAESGNIEATTLRYFGMMTKCVDCHEHLRMRADF